MQENDSQVVNLYIFGDLWASKLRVKCWWNWHLELSLVKEQGDLNNDQEGKSGQVGVGQVIQEHPL